MLHAILPAAAPRATSAASTTVQKPDSDAVDRFDSIYDRSGARPEPSTESRGKRSPETELGARQVEAEAGAIAKVVVKSEQPVVALSPGGDETASNTSEKGDAETGEATEPVVAEAPDAMPIKDPLVLQPAPTDAKVTAPSAATDPPIQANEPAPSASDGESAERATAPAPGVDAENAGENGDEPPRDRPTERDVPRRSDWLPPQPEPRVERRAAERVEPSAPGTAPRGIEVAVPSGAERAHAIAPTVDTAPAIAATNATQTTAPAQPTTIAAASTQAAPTVVEQLAMAVKQSGDGRVDLTLSPIELGKVRLTLLTGETGITVAIRADRDDTLDLFRRNSDALAQEFRQMGYGSVGFEFSGGGKSGQSREREDDSDALAPTETAISLPQGILRLTGIGGLDIRL